MLSLLQRFVAEACQQAPQPEPLMLKGTISLSSSEDSNHVLILDAPEDLHLEESFKTRGQMITRAVGLQGESQDRTGLFNGYSNPVALEIVFRSRELASEVPATR